MSIATFGRKISADSPLKIIRVIAALIAAIAIGAVSPALAAPLEGGVEILDVVQADASFDRARMASDAGHAEGDEALAWFYETGTGVAADQSRALGLYRRAAEAGRKHAQWRLGVMLDEGRGARADPKAAFAWISEAARQDYGPAIVSLAVMQATGRGTDADNSAALHSYLRAAKLGEPHGFYGMGVLFARGEGMKADKAEAAAWMFVAQQLGDASASQALSELLDGLDDSAIDAIADRAVVIADRLEVRFTQDARSPLPLG